MPFLTIPCTPFPCLTIPIWRRHDNTNTLFDVNIRDIQSINNYKFEFTMPLQTSYYLISSSGIIPSLTNWNMFGYAVTLDVNRNVTDFRLWVNGERWTSTKINPELPITPQPSMGPMSATTTTALNLGAVDNTNNPIPTQDTNSLSYYTSVLSNVQAMQLFQDGQQNITTALTYPTNIGAWLLGKNDYAPGNSIYYSGRQTFCVSGTKNGNVGIMQA